MFGNFPLPSCGALGKEFFHTSGKLLHVLTIYLSSPDSFPLPPMFPNRAVGQALLFRFFQSLLFD